MRVKIKKSQNKGKILKYENRIYSNKKESKMAKQKKIDWFLEFLKWGSLILAILFFLWLARQLGWI